MSTETLVLLIVAILGSGGGAAFVTTLIKARPEAGAILINAAQDVVLIQKGTIEDLSRRVAAAEERAEEAEKRAAHAESENRSLRRRIEALERRDQQRDGS